MSDATYRRGYCTATASKYYVVVHHSKFDTPADIARAARECNYRAGNWNRSKLTRFTTVVRDGQPRGFTLYAIERN